MSELSREARDHGKRLRLGRLRDVGGEARGCGAGPAVVKGQRRDCLWSPPLRTWTRDAADLRQVFGVV